MKTIGIVGGGQLGLMLADAAHALGMQVAILDPDINSPAIKVADEHILGALDDQVALEALKNKSDFITYEIERAMSTDIYKDKFLQKKFLHQIGVRTADFSDKVNYEPPYILKARHDAYDGRGNASVLNHADQKSAMAKIGDRPYYVEAFAPFVKELAGVGARDQKGNIKLFPIVETIHKDHICDLVMSPAPISIFARSNAEAVTTKVLEHLNGVGVFTVEMFLLADDSVLVNEIAPRVHNSGHLTIEANHTSQFSQHIRAITGMELGDTSLKVQSAVMKNILGSRTGKATLAGIDECQQIPGVFVHIYGKVETRPQRKMGHITAVADTLEVARANAEKAYSYITI